MNLSPTVTAAVCLSLLESVTHIGHRTAAVRAVGHHAARGLVGAGRLLVRTRNCQDERSHDQHFISVINKHIFGLHTSSQLTIVGHSGRDLLQHRHMRLTGLADLLLQVAYCVARATVDMIAAAHGLHVIKTPNRE